jgi:4-hydroxy-4-methyl-2-oxoglutarate aldolase
MDMNQMGMVKRTILRADKAAVEKLSRFGVATIHEAMGRVGLMKPICGRFIPVLSAAVLR